MRSVIVCSLFAATANAWPWPWHNPNKTTTPPPSETHAFEHGVAKALGFTDVTTCYNASVTGVHDLWEAAEDYRRGGYVSKAEALEKFAGGIHLVVEALEPCSSSMTDASKYKTLVAYMMDPRYYTAHNALTLALNTAEDRKQLGAFVGDWTKGDFEAAGAQLVATAMDILIHPGMPSKNGTEAVQIAAGIAEGFTSDIDITCFKDVGVEIPAVIGGVIDIATVVDVVKGIESVFHGLEGLVPTYKACLSDKPQLMAMLKEFEDFKHPSKLAGKVVEAMKANGVDLGLEAASAVLAYKGGEWEHFGLQLGKMLGKMALPSAKAPIVV